MSRYPHTWRVVAWHLNMQRDLLKARGEIGTNRAKHRVLEGAPELDAGIALGITMVADMCSSLGFNVLLVDGQHVG
jgi:hypothetical protein